MKTVAKKTLLAGAAVLALSGAAQAANIDLNIYGASAQYNFWKAQGEAFLAGKLCTGITKINNSKDQGIVRGTCGSDTVTIRFASKASYDGINVIKGVDDIDGVNTCGATMREMLVSPASSSTKDCYPVHAGASDVAGESFMQSSEGAYAGPAGGAATTRAFTGIDTTGLNYARPIVVPFGFFANSNIKVSTCDSGVHAGNFCTTATAAADCGAGVTCSQNTISNITREQAVQIFSAQVFDWTDFGPAYTVVSTPLDTTLNVCMRHAGSGTHATLDKVMFNGAAPNGLYGGTESGPNLFYNGGSSEELACINTLNGAIGYADSDAVLKTPAGGGTSYMNVVELTYNGLKGRKNTIKNGAYDFFSNQWLYTNNTIPAASNTLYQELVAYASNPAKMPALYAPFWAAQDEMKFNKADDSSYPQKK